MKDKQYYVYVMMNKWNTTSYIGVTSSLHKRIWEHRNKFVKGFAEKYQIDKLVHYEVYHEPMEAIAREKQLKRWSRRKKIDLIMKENPELRDLSEDLGI